MDPRGKTGLSIFSRLLLALLGVVVLISGLLTTVFYVYSKRTLEKQAPENVRRQFEAITYHFRSEIRDKLVKDLQLLASNPVLDEFLGAAASGRDASARGVERFFLTSLKYSRNYERISYAGPSGKETVRIDWSGRVRAYRDIGGRPLFLRIKEGLQGSVDAERPVRDRQGNLLFTAGIYKIDEVRGAFGGVVLVEYNLKDFVEYLDRIRIFEENPVWLFTPDGVVLKQPEEKQSFFDPRPALEAGFYKDPLLVTSDGNMVVYQDLFINPDRPLLRLAVSVPSQRLRQDMQKVLRFFLIVSLFSLPAISIIAYPVAGYLSRPIVELAHAASRLAKGDLSTRVAGTSTGEVQLLIDSFNRMSEDLEKTTVSRDYVDNIIRSMMDTLIVVAPEGTITQVNAAVCALLSYDEDELVGRPLGLILERDASESAAIIAEVLNKGFMGDSERVYRGRNGQRVLVLFSASLMHDRHSNTKRVVCVARDITDRKRDEEKLKAYSDELREINEELKSFTYIISHDLRAPLVNIKGFSEELIHGIREIGPLLEKYLDGFSPPERRKFSEVLNKDIPEALLFIGSSVTRMDNLINALLKLSRAGRRKLNPELLSVQDLVQRIVSSLAHQMESRGVTVTAKGLPEVVADKTALEQIFGNLLDNAVKYLESGRAGEIEISCEQNDAEAVFHVRDNGRGMNREDIPKAFEIFRRVGRQDTQGEGIGLAFVKTLVRLHGGRIWCESEPGVGTTFSFLLPKPNEAAANRIPEEKLTAREGAVMEHREGGNNNA